MPAAMTQRGLKHQSEEASFTCVIQEGPVDELQENEYP